MCKSCFCSSVVSGVATWAFFTLFLKMLGVANPGFNSIWLTLLIFVAVMYCPIMNPKIGECCLTKPKKKK